jgi:hypothetical protein
MSGGTFPVPPSLIALFPLLLELIERILEQIGLAGDTLVERLLAKDTRQVWTSLPAGQRPSILELMKEYFRFGERVDQIIRAHLAFLLSIYFANVEHTKDMLEVKGWPVAGLVVVGVSLFVFLVQLSRGTFQVARKHQLPAWRIWFWVQLIVILGIQIAEHLRE